MAARLPLYSPGRKPQWKTVPQFDDHYAARRPLARCGLAIRHLGRLARITTRPDPCRAEPRDLSEQGRAGGLLDRPADDLSAGQHRMGLLPRGSRESRRIWTDLGAAGI